MPMELKLGIKVPTPLPWKLLSLGKNNHCSLFDCSELSFACLGWHRFCRKILSGRCFCRGKLPGMKEGRL